MIRDNRDDDRLPWIDDGDKFILLPVNGSPRVEYCFLAGQLSRRIVQDDGHEFEDGSSHWKPALIRDVWKIPTHISEPIWDWIKEKLIWPGSGRE